MFELRDLECFLAIVEYGHFGRAAEALGIAQPPLSRRIASLEKRLGVALFSREHRQIEITNAGQALAREARTLLTQAHLAGQITRDAALGFVGHLRLGFFGFSEHDIMPNAIRSFRNAYPRTTLTVTELLGTRQIDALRSGRIDVTLVRGPVEPDGLGRQQLRADSLVAALPDNHALARRKRINVADLAGQAFIELNRYRAPGFHDLVRGVCAEAGFAPHITAVVDTFETLAACIASGIGVSLVHESVQTLPIGGIAYRPISPASPPIDLTCIWRNGDGNPLLPTFVEHLRAAAVSGRARFRSTRPKK